jgi:hypothetical protein
MQVAAAVAQLCCSTNTASCAAAAGPQVQLVHMHPLMRKSANAATVLPSDSCSPTSVCIAAIAVALQQAVSRAHNVPQTLLPLRCSLSTHPHRSNLLHAVPSCRSSLEPSAGDADDRVTSSHPRVCSAGVGPGDRLTPQSSSHQDTFTCSCKRPQVLQRLLYELYKLLQCPCVWHAFTR